MRRNCFKCMELCYTLGRWEFERSTRHCMEFKITKDKMVRWNKMLLFSTGFFYRPLLSYWFLLSVWPISSFLAGFQVFVAAFYRQSQGWGWTLLFWKTWIARLLSHRNSNPLLNFSPRRKERLSIGPLSRSALKNLFKAPLKVYSNLNGKLCP